MLHYPSLLAGLAFFSIINQVRAFKLQCSGNVDKSSYSERKFWINTTFDNKSEMFDMNDIYCFQYGSKNRAVALEITLIGFQRDYLYVHTLCEVQKHLHNSKFLDFTILVEKFNLVREMHNAMEKNRFNFMFSLAQKTNTGRKTVSIDFQIRCHFQKSFAFGISLNGARADLNNG